MNIGRFAEGYQRDDIDTSRENSELVRSASRSLMRSPHKWSRFFGDFAQSYLEGTIDDPVVFKTDLLRYSSDAVEQQLRNTRDFMQEHAYHFPSLAMWLNSLNFHTINREMLRYWDHLIDEENQPSPDTIDITVMQARLSIRSLELVAQRRAFQRRAQERGVASDIDRSFAGQITEIDSAVALLEAIKRQPLEQRDRLALIPAPFSFDYGAPDGKSIDFLLIDTELEQAHGIQVKTNGQGRSARQQPVYDSEFVTTIDGIRDLRNFSSGHLTADGEVTQRPLPGLLSADFLQTTPGINRVSTASHLEGMQGYYGLLLDARPVAHEIMPYIADDGRLGRIADALGERVLTGLYKD